MNSRKTKRGGLARSAARPRRPDVKSSRPVVRDAVRMKRRILRVAAAEFARKGYDGARVDEIVRSCGVSKNLIYHYFDSKETLFIAVLEAAYAKLRDRQQAMHLESCPPVEAIMRLVVDSFKYWSESRSVIAYLNSENFNDARHIRKSAYIRNAYTGLVGSIREVLERGQQEGVFRPGVDPIHLYISVSALAYHFFSNQRTFSVIFGKDFRSRDMLAERLQHVQEVILGYLRFVPERGLPSATNG